MPLWKDVPKEPGNSHDAEAPQPSASPLPIGSPVVANMADQIAQLDQRVQQIVQVIPDTGLLARQFAGLQERVFNLEKLVTSLSQQRAFHEVQLEANLRAEALREANKAFGPINPETPDGDARVALADAFLAYLKPIHN